MAETLDLEFCPFCEGDGRLERTLRDGYADFKDDPDAYAHFVVCKSCAAQGPWHKTPGNAVRSWNMRPLAEQRQAEAERLQAENASMRGALIVLLAAGKDAITEIRERSFARKPLSRAIDLAQNRLDGGT